MQDALPNVHADLIDIPSLEQLAPRTPSLHKPRILLLYGSRRNKGGRCHLVHGIFSRARPPEQPGRCRPGR